jgi:hypothetical protein
MIRATAEISHLEPTASTYDKFSSVILTPK